MHSKTYTITNTLEEARKVFYGGIDRRIETLLKERTEEDQALPEEIFWRITTLKKTPRPTTKGIITSIKLVEIIVQDLFCSPKPVNKKPIVVGSHRGVLLCMCFDSYGSPILICPRKAREITRRIVLISQTA